MNEQQRRPAAFVDIVQPHPVDIDEFSARRQVRFHLVRGPPGKQNEAEQDQDNERDGDARNPNNYFLPPRPSHIQ
jgi:hypothetical protein